MSTTQPKRLSSTELRDLSLSFWLSPEDYSSLLEYTASAMTSNVLTQHPEDLAISFEMANDAICAVISWYREHWSTVGVVTYRGILSE